MVAPWRTRFTIFVVLIMLAVLTAAPAQGVRLSRPGAEFAREVGTCTVRTPGLHTSVACGLPERNRLYYRFWLPPRARGVAVKVHYDFVSEREGCCGWLRREVTRRGSGRRLLIVKVVVHNYGNPLGYYRPIIHRVEIRYRSRPS